MRHARSFPPLYQPIRLTANTNEPNASGMLTETREGHGPQQEAPQRPGREFATTLFMALWRVRRTMGGQNVWEELPHHLRREVTARLAAAGVEESDASELAQTMRGDAISAVPL